ncbi:ribosomal protein S5 domain 2-like protein [Punctularia strigosozonata HHB-11173 SS5]|uniref:ribosomal protein S5 domain 2-like protein n=1 Tax=Punctularia strigosozonata (strain HHB-11173) TaxID=741275 RepID=UPI0004416E4F|nr:ribosomal protein S5 domain 2-like protein [Punctularia strigosozonata HHB-11173 SS5]EIN07338.1 ribosomal protein S5 domain 2-like protein [Punctularia strigosozonata HHB-11173 SS5]
MALNTDRRRINGPEESFHPDFVERQATSDSSKRWNPGEPRNGRGASDIRPIFLKAGLISQANGSAYIETERTKLVCAVYGPRQSKSTSYSEKGKLNVEVKFAPFSCTRRRVPNRDAEDRPIAMLIQRSLNAAVRLELFPKSTIDIFITIIENDGIEGCVASGTVAASTALAQARIEMLGMVMSCSAANTADVGKELWLDPTDAESRLASGILVLACLPALGIVTNVWQSGKMIPARAIDCMKACQERCADIHSVVAQALLDNVKET